MNRVEIKPNRTSEQCACKSHSAKHKIEVKGIYVSPQKTILLCEDCFRDLKKEINS